ncbi:pseudouridine synthase [Flavobacterium sp.]|uniref:pseudouridine synthase n=1 Tax=Flavobacterium sp. TaxID=239 RepID=UPI003527636C
MSRHQGNDKRNAGSGRQGGYKKSSYSRGNAPVKNNTSNFSRSENKPTQTKTKPETDGIRLNKYISNSGVCSRREADIYIQSGNVKVNGEVITEMGYKVKPNDEVLFDGTRLTPEKKVYLLLNKPKNFSTSDDDGQANVLNLVRNATKAPIKPVGRMDKTTTGLLLFTNDNDMLTKFSQPKQRSSKLYQISLDKNLKFEDFEKIEKGLFIDDHKIMVEEISYIENEPKSEIGVKMKTANVKVVRRIFEHLNYNVLKLDRVTFAGLTKKNLPRGNWRFLTEQEIINLRNI